VTVAVAQGDLARGISINLAKQRLRALGLTCRTN